MTRSAKIFAALGLLATLAAGASRADNRPRAADVLTKTVSIADLDPKRSADASVLKRRLHTASVELCLRATEELVLGEQLAAYGQCVTSATDAALHDAALIQARRAATPAVEFALR